MSDYVFPINLRPSGGGGGGCVSGGGGKSDDGHGITLRDLLAAMAMQGLLADPEACKVSRKLAAEAYEYADAMLDQRKR